MPSLRARPPARTIVVSLSVTTGRPYQPVGPRMRRTRRPGSGHDQHPGFVVNVGTGGPQAGLADPEVVAAQQQVNRLRAAGSRRHHHGDHRPCRAAARPRGNVQRYGSLQLRNELLARGGRPVRPPPLHTLTIAPAWTGRQGHCSCAAWSWVPAQVTLPGSRVDGLQAAVVSGAAHLFEEPGTLDAAARLARDWFLGHLPHDPA